MTTPPFDSLADLYDLLTDWEKRLPREISFLDRVFRRVGVRTVLDAACGTGAHLEALAERGYAVSGADLAPEMVAQARRRCGPEVRVVETGFAELPEHFGPHDAVMVVGNSLPNAGSEEGVRSALAGLAAVVAADGALLLHLLSYPAVIRQGGGPKPPRRVESGGREYVFLKELTVLPDRVVLEVVARVSGRGQTVERRLRSDLWPVTLPWLEHELEALGLKVLMATDGFSEAAYDEATSGDLLVLARRKERLP